ncbi:MAG: hypothetical protein N3I86_01110 [Verrucomicrobiae bacterium]|nr:hypothetical protein [Verrucomicrobiae bacterium]
MNPACAFIGLRQLRGRAAWPAEFGGRAWIGLLAAWGLGAVSVWLPAQSLPPGPPGRYLLVVETSEAMRPRAAAALRVMETLLVSGMHGQFRAGDTLGVWTYNDDLHAGELPLQVWTPQTERLVASNVVAFLRERPFEKAARLAVVWPDVEELVRESPRLTVVWVTSGSEPCSGTPYDAQINEFFNRNGRGQSASRMPFVIVLRAQQGAFCGVTLNLAPWPVLLPSFPPWVARAKPAEPPPAPKPLETRSAEARPVEKPHLPSAPAGRTEPIVRPPLIIVGKKDEPSPPAPPAGTTSATAAGPAPTAETKSAGSTATPEVEHVLAAAPVEPVPKPEAAVPPPLAAAPTVPAPAQVSAPATPEQKPPDAGAASGSTAVASKNVAAVETPVRPVTVPPPEETPGAKLMPVEPPPTSQPATPMPAPTPGAPAMATATPAGAPRSMWWVWAAGGVCVAGALALWVWIRPSRASPRASLITRSLEAHRRPPRE